MGCALVVVRCVDEVAYVVEACLFRPPWHLFGHGYDGGGRRALVDTNCQVVHILDDVLRKVDSWDVRVKGVRRGELVLDLVGCVSILSLGRLGILDLILAPVVVVTSLALRKRLLYFRWMVRRGLVLYGLLHSIHS